MTHHRQYILAKNAGIFSIFLTILASEFIGLRTSAIVVGLGKVKQYASKLDQEIGSLRRDLSDLRKSTPEDAPQKLADPLETMGMYTALTAAATGVGVDKSTKILQRMEKQKR